MDEDADGDDGAARREKSRRFFTAVKHGDVQTVEAMFSADPFFHLRDTEDGYAAIHYAVAYKCRAVVRLLLKYECDLSVKDPLGRTPATIAVEVADDPRMGAILREIGYRRARRVRERILNQASRTIADSLKRTSQTKIVVVRTQEKARGPSPWASPPKKR